MSADRRSRHPSARWLLAGYAGLAGFFAIEAGFRQPGRAASLEASTGDRGTTEGIVLAYGLAGGLAPLLRLLPIGRLPRAVGPLGLVLQVGGLGLRAWSMQTLGAAYSRTLRTEDAPRVVEDGPYALVRHPGYLGSVLIWTGFGLTTGSAAAAGTAVGLVGRAYSRRIDAEEAMLRRDLPGYVDYAARTRRLVPFVW